MLNKRNYIFHVDQQDLQQHTVVQSNRYYNYDEKKPYGRWRHTKDVATPRLCVYSNQLVDVEVDDDNYHQIREWTSNYWQYDNTKGTTIETSVYVHVPDGDGGFQRQERRLTNLELYELELAKAVQHAVNKIEERWEARLKHDANIEFNLLAKFLHSKNTAKK